MSHKAEIPHIYFANIPINAMFTIVQLHNIT